MIIKDRLILIALIISIWALIGTIWLKPSDSFAHADGHTHDAWDIYGVAEEGHTHDYAVKRIVENCSVYDDSISC